jgi:hypothetical protein
MRHISARDPQETKMPAHALATPPLVEPLWRIQFAILDLVRRAQGRALGGGWI